RAADLRRKAADRCGVGMKASSLIDCVREREGIRLWLMEGDELGCHAEYLADPIADGLRDSLKVELPGKRLADLVDDGELGIALLGLSEQMLRLIKEAGVL